MGFKDLMNISIGGILKDHIIVGAENDFRSYEEDKWTK